MAYRVKHYQSDWWKDDQNVFDDTPSAPTPAKKKAMPETRAKLRPITIDRKTGKKTYGPEEDLPLTSIKAKDF